jgi:drug/metabolite transporter (DMT)-like permease
MLRLWPFLLLVAAVIFGRAFYYTAGRRLRDRFGGPLGEPEMTPGREFAGLVLLILGVVAASLIAYACPFPRME